eukprot:364347-Chlamydomonas_euryale.AAC.10
MSRAKYLGERQLLRGINSLARPGISGDNSRLHVAGFSGSARGSDVPAGGVGLTWGGSGLCAMACPL